MSERKSSYTMMKTGIVTAIQNEFPRLVLTDQMRVLIERATTNLLDSAWIWANMGDQLAQQLCGADPMNVAPLVPNVATSTVSRPELQEWIKAVRGAYGMGTTGEVDKAIRQIGMAPIGWKPQVLDRILKKHLQPRGPMDGIVRQVHELRPDKPELGYSLYVEISKGSAKSKVICTTSNYWLPSADQFNRMVEEAKIDTGRRTSD